MNPPETIRTPRLILRMPTLQDAEAIFSSYAQDAEITKYLTWRPHQNIEETKTFLRSRIAAWESKSEFSWVITIPPNNRAAGMVGLRISGFRANFGYVLARACWGQGIMTEALKAVIDWVGRQKEIRRIWAVCDVENMASARVMEKCGLQKEGLLRNWMLHPNRSDQPRDCLCYARIFSHD
ncbi:MAG: GNAT family N-acetyltransferase [bacterium]